MAKGTRIGLLSCLLLTSAVPQVGAEGPDVNALLAQAREALAAGDQDKALQLADKAIEGSLVMRVFGTFSAELKEELVRRIKSGEPVRRAAAETGCFAARFTNGLRPTERWGRLGSIASGEGRARADCLALRGELRVTPSQPLMT